MADQFETRRLTTEAEPVGLLTEGAAGIAIIVLAIIGLAGISAEVLASIATIVIGVGLMMQAFNSAAEQSRLVATGAAVQQMTDFGGEIMVDVLAGVAGIVLGVLALIGVNAAHLVPIALIAFGGSLLLSGMIAGWSRSAIAASGIEILAGVTAVVLGILTLVTMKSWILVFAGFIVVGVAMLMVSASFTGAVLRLFTATTTRTTSTV
jgi:hypothetical protein